MNLATPLLLATCDRIRIFCFVIFCTYVHRVRVSLSHTCTTTCTQRPSRRPSCARGWCPATPASCWAPPTATCRTAPRCTSAAGGPTPPAVTHTIHRLANSHTHTHTHADYVCHTSAKQRIHAVGLTCTCAYTYTYTHTRYLFSHKFLLAPRAVWSVIAAKTSSSHEIKQKWSVQQQYIIRIKPFGCVLNTHVYTNTYFWICNISIYPYTKAHVSPPQKERCVPGVRGACTRAGRACRRRRAASWP